jgi:shikimate kinase
MKNVIALIGMPGSGKSTIGRQLARRLRLDFVDTDQFIEARIGCSIRDYFGREGEVAFRDVEQAVIDELTRREGVVLATGGGVVLRPANRQHLRARCQVVYLRASPLLQVEDPLQRLREMYQVRDPLYRQTAHFVIDTGRPSVGTLVNMITMQLELAGRLPVQRPRR